MCVYRHTCFHLQTHNKKNTKQKHRLRAECHSQTHSQNRGAKKKKRVEAPLGTRHMGCLTLEDIDIVEWQVGLEVALSENCHYRSLKRWRKIVLLDL